MNDAASTSTRPYLIRAIHEWCSDNGFTPYLAVRVNRMVQVPLEYVKDGEIVLNVSYDATGGLHLGNDYITFKARFGGKPREIMVPVERVMAIYARESGQGMSFPVIDEVDEEAPDDGAANEAIDAPVVDDSTAAEESAAPAAAPARDSRVVQLVPTGASAAAKDGEEGGGDDTPPAPPTRPKGAKLTRVK